MKSAWRRLGALSAFVCVSFVAPARADVGASKKASAEALFDEALRLMKAGNHAEACPKLESSQKLDPGIGTLLYLGECYERIGRTASAWATFREAASAADAVGQNKRVKMARERSVRLEQQLAYLTIDVVDATRALAGLSIRRDGVAWEAGMIGAAVPVDPGPVTVEATAPGYEPFSLTVQVAARARETVLVPVLTQTPPPPPPAPPPVVKVETPVAKPPPPPPPVASARPREDPGKTQRWIGISLGGLGLVGAGVGTYFGVRAINEDSDADAGSCDETTCQEAGDFEHADSANRSAVASNVAFAIGGALFATGIVVYLTAPHGPEGSAIRVTPRVGPAFAGLGVEGRL